MERPQKITLAEMRSSGIRGLLVYCSDYRCSHYIAISGDRWPDDVRLSRPVRLQRMWQARR
jgi:GT2 family glycosyltransferase